MKKYIETVSNNITELRKRNKLTQAEFGARINYSDKSVSKWERGDALPDLLVLKTMSDAFDVPVEYFLYEHKEDEAPKTAGNAFLRGNAIAIMALMACFVYLVAAVVFVYTRIYLDKNLWTVFVWAVPLSLLLVMFFAKRFLKRPVDVYSSSAFVWTLLAAVYLQFLEFNVWIIFFIGVPLQAAIILIELLRRNRQKYNGQ